MNTTESDAIDEKLRTFEAIVDKNDPDQVRLLEEMREHTRRLHQVRGDWNTPSTFRNWNDPSTRPEASRDPLSIEAFREYKKHVEQEQKPALLLAQETERKMLGAPAKLKNGNS